MECRKFRRMVSREIDGALENAEREKLERHLVSCAACRSFREACLAGISLHRSVPETAVPSSILPSILAAVEARPQGGRLHGWLRFAMSAAAAAAAILGFWVGGLMHERYTPAGAENQAEVLGLEYLEEYPPDSFGDILTASNEGGGNEQR
jgi:predicted anti-sigma-YlaC factor YlaD